MFETEWVTVFATMSVYSRKITDADEQTATPRRPQRFKRSTPVNRASCNSTSVMVQKLREKFESATPSEDSPTKYPLDRNGGSASELRPTSVDAARCGGKRPGNLYSCIRKNLQPTPGASSSEINGGCDATISDRRPESETVQSARKSPSADAVYAQPNKKRSSVLLRARQYESVCRTSSLADDFDKKCALNREPCVQPVPRPGQSSTTASTRAASGMPSNVAQAAPVKPPRTFVHDVYVLSKLRKKPLPDKRGSGEKEELLKNPLYGRHDFAVDSSQKQRKEQSKTSAVGRVADQLWTRGLFSDAIIHEYDEVCIADVSRPSSKVGKPLLRRSLSVEHIYADPGALRATKEDAANERTGPSLRELHYMSSPVAGVKDDGMLSPGCRRGRAFTCQVRDAINHSFTSVRKRPRKNLTKHGDQNDVQADSSSEVSVKDVQKRLVYVRSIRRAYMENSISDCSSKPPLLDFVFIVGYKSIDPNMPPQPEVLHRFPKEDADSVFDPLVIAHLCLPQESGLAESEHFKRQIFYFTLVRENGEKTFFHCLTSALKPNVTSTEDTHKAWVVLCLATRTSAPAFYHKLLVDLEEPMARLAELGWTDLLSSLSKQCLPSPGCKLVCQRLSTGQGDVAITTSRPLDDKFEWAKLTPLLGVLEDTVLLRIVSSLVLERRVILVSDNHTLLHEWVEAVESLLYPFKWRHVKVPVLPKSLLVQCSSQEPYLLGVPASLAHMALELLSGPVLVVDVDRGALLSEDQDNGDVIPKKLQKALCTALSLAKNMTDPTGRVRDMMITEAFVRLFVELVGHCDQHILFPGDDKGYNFQRETFMKAPSSRGAQMFLQWFVETQAFELFLQERAERVRQLAKTPHHHLLPKGLFERRANEYQLDLEQSGRTLKEFGKRVKNIGERLWHLRAFQRD